MRRAPASGIVFLLAMRSRKNTKGNMMRTLLLSAGLCISVLSLPVRARAAGNYVNSELPWHEVAVDAQNKLLAWYHPEKNLGYDKVLHLGWDFIEHKVPRDTRHGTGLKIYIINSVFDGK